MNIGDCMTKELAMIKSSDSIRAAAAMMAQADTGILPVGEGERLVGMVTDRDIALRAVGAGKGPDCKVSEVMTPAVRYCFEDDEVESVAKNMAELQLRRLLVVDREKRLVGMVSLGDMARQGDCAVVGEAMGVIARRAAGQQQAPAA